MSYHLCPCLMYYDKPNICILIFSCLLTASIIASDIFNWQDIIVGQEDNHFVKVLFLVTLHFGIKYPITLLRVMDSKAIDITIIFHFIYLI